MVMIVMMNMLLPTIQGHQVRKDKRSLLKGGH